MNYKIAILLTCHNRCQKTIKALDTIFKAVDYNNEHGIVAIDIKVFLTDDGCTDDTASIVLDTFPAKDITIIVSGGDEYWAGGMRLAWSKAINSNDSFDFYLLINDDVVFLETAIVDMLQTHAYCLETYKMGGVYTGFIADINEPQKVIYGAKYYRNAFLSKAYDMVPNGMPKECRLTNANMLLVDKTVVDRIGQLSDQYRHGGADWDYGMRASLAGLPVLTTQGICGFGENDHDSNKEEHDKVIKMNLYTRRQYLNRPQREYHDAFVFLRRYQYSKFVVLKVAYWINLYMPRVFYKLQSLRP